MMTRTYEIMPRPSNLGFWLKLFEDGKAIGEGCFPVCEGYSEAKASDDAMANAEAWVAHGRDYRTQMQLAIAAPTQE